MICPICKLDVCMTQRAAADWEAGQITKREAEKRSLISHARHEHTNYEKALRRFPGEITEGRTDRVKAQLQDHYNDIARRRLGFGKRRHSWEDEITGEAKKQKRLEL